MKTLWVTNYTRPEEGVTLEVMLNRLDKYGHTIFSIMFVGHDSDAKQYCIVSYQEVEVEG